MQDISEMQDVFPSRVSSVVEPLDNYPTLDSFEDFFPFVLYIHINIETIFYTKREIQDTYHLHSLLDECRKSALDWEILPDSTRVEPFLKPEGRRGYRMGNCYLVQPFFTFGYRTVLPGHTHVYQILGQPVLFCRWNRSRLQERSIPSPEDLQKTEKRILKPWNKYAVPPGVGYIIFTTQNSLFALDVVPVPLPFSCQDVSTVEKYEPAWLPFPFQREIF